MALMPAKYGYQTNLHGTAMVEFAENEYTLGHAIAGVDAGLGGGFANTRDLKAMKYDEATTKDPEGWGRAIEEEHQRMIDNDVGRPVKLSKVPKGAKVLISTWACKLKSNDTKRSRINGRSYEQID
eukprot:2719932-Ditylum_brightwellii.AAC.1